MDLYTEEGEKQRQKQLNELCNRLLLKIHDDIEAMPDEHPYVQHQMDKFLLMVRDYRDEYEGVNDPMVFILMVVHNTLAYQERWKQYSIDAYNVLHRQLKFLSQFTLTELKQTSLTEELIQFTFHQLMEVGFDLQPYTLEL